MLKPSPPEDLESCHHRIDSQPDQDHQSQVVLEYGQGVAEGEWAVRVIGGGSGQEGEGLGDGHVGHTLLER